MGLFFGWPCIDFDREKNLRSNLIINCWCWLMMFTFTSRVPLIDRFNWQRACMTELWCACVWLLAQQKDTARNQPQTIPTWIFFPSVITHTHIWRNCSLNVINEQGKWDSICQAKTFKFFGRLYTVALAIPGLLVTYSARSIFWIPWMSFPLYQILAITQVHPQYHTSNFIEWKEWEPLKLSLDIDQSLEIAVFSFHHPL